MPVFKHVEYKIVCDECLADLSDYVPAKNKAQAVRRIKKDYGISLVYNEYLCENCTQKKYGIQSTNQEATAS